MNGSAERSDDWIAGDAVASEVGSRCEEEVNLDDDEN